MPVVTEYIHVDSNGRGEIIDITSKVRSAIDVHKITAGIAVVFVPGSTASVTTIEYEPGLKKDMKRVLERLIPYGDNYAHHDTWHDDNGSSHVQASIMGPSMSVPIVDGKMTLGTWQQIVVIDCDTRPRDRKIVVQLMY